MRNSPRMRAWIAVAALVAAPMAVLAQPPAPPPAAAGRWR